MMVLGQWSRLVVQLGSLVVLSFLLPPSAFGLVAMVTAITGIANVVGDLGLSLSALTSAPLDQNQRSKLFAANLIAGIVLTVAVIGSGPVLALLYHENRVTPIAAAISPVFLLNATSVQFRVELNLLKLWKRLAFAESVGPVVGLAVAVVFAAITHSYWALVLQPIVAACTQLAATVALAGWRPSWPHKGSGIKSHLRFGRDTLFLQAVTYLTSNADNVMVGRRFGASILGEYARSYQVAMLPVQQLAGPLTRVVLPRLANIESDAFNLALRKLQRMLCYAMLAPLSFIIGTAGPLTRTAFGPAWPMVPELLRILALGSAFVAIAYIYYWAFVARRAIGLLALTEVVSRVVMIVAIIGAASLSAPAVAWAVVVGQALLWVGSAWVGSRRLGIQFVGLVRAMAPAVLAFAPAAVVGLVAERYVRLSQAPLALLLEALIWLACVGVAVIVVRPIRRDARAVVRKAVTRPAKPVRTRVS